jgi:hypothetical protein
MLFRIFDLFMCFLIIIGIGTVDIIAFETFMKIYKYVSNQDY